MYSVQYLYKNCTTDADVCTDIRFQMHNTDTVCTVRYYMSLDINVLYLTLQYENNNLMRNVVIILDNI